MDRFGKKAIPREKGGVSTLITDRKRKASIHSRVNGMKKEERREREREINLYKKKNIYEQIHKYHRGDRSNDGESEVREAEKRKKIIKKKERWWKSDAYPPWKYSCGVRDREKIRAAYPVRTKR